MSTNFSKVAAVLSHIVGETVQVVSPDEDLIDDDRLTLSVKEVFEHSHDYTEQLDTSEEHEFDVSVRLPTNQLITLHVSSSDTIAEIKSSIEMKTSYPARRCRLRQLSGDLSDDMTVGGSNIKSSNTLFVPRPEGGRMSKPPTLVFKLSSDEFAPRYNFDFTNMVDDGKTYMRGGYKYERP